MRHPDPIKLQRLVDGELRGRQERQLKAHLDGCSDCAAAVERIRATGDLLRLSFEEALEEAPLEGFADAVMTRLEREQQDDKVAALPWSERAKAWFGEFLRYRRKLWAPPLALAGAGAAALLVVLIVGREPPSRELPQGSSVISVSFGNSVDGTVFELEDKDGSTTAVIWIDESKSTGGSEGEASYNRGRGIANKRKGGRASWMTAEAKGKSSEDQAVVAALDGYLLATTGAKTT